jgi:hypothetical protein
MEWRGTRGREEEVIWTGRKGWADRRFDFSILFLEILQSFWCRSVVRLVAARTGLRTGISWNILLSSRLGRGRSLRSVRCCLGFMSTTLATFSSSLFIPISQAQERKVNNATLTFSTASRAHMPHRKGILNTILPTPPLRHIGLPG